MPEKYEREIEELLRQMGDLAQQEGWRTRLRRRWGRIAGYFHTRTHSLDRILTPGNIIKASLLLLVASFLLRAFVPRLSVYAYLIGLVLLVVGIAAFVLSERSAPEHRWRGRIIDLSGQQQPWWISIWYRWRDFWHRPSR